MSYPTRTSTISRRRFLTTSAATVGALAGAGSLLDACNTSTTTGPGGKSVTTVTVMYANNEFSQDYINAFEKANPDIKINFIVYDRTRLDAMLAANTPPDFVRGTGLGSASYSARG